MFPFQQDHNHHQAFISSSSQISFSQDPNNQIQDFIIEDNFLGGQFNSLVVDPHKDTSINYINFNPTNFQGVTGYESSCNMTTNINLVAPSIAATSGVDSANVVCNKHTDKKIIRKEIERERRKQMTSLQSQLRSLLPLEAVKGKRSISDHMNEAVKYVQQLKKNIHELTLKRDKLKTLMPSNSGPDGNGTECSRNCTNYVRVLPCLEGLEIVLCSGSEQQDGVRVSRIIEALLENGLDVASYTSVIRDERLYHTLHCKATNSTCVDVAALQQKLNDVILST